ncbi:hypothetical protein [Brevibacterium aurantiacum]|nr:hypothetical protein [Brevibacterium aurantiacum]
MRLDESNNGSFQVISVTPRVDRDGVQRTDRENVNQWELETLHRPADGGSAQVIKVRVASASEPSIRPMAEVQFKEFEAFFWQMGDRAGVSLSAIQAVPVAGGSQPHTEAKGRGD